MVDQVAEFLIRKTTSAHCSNEVDMRQHPFQAPVPLLQSTQRLIQLIADITMGVFDLFPSGRFRHIKGGCITGRIFCSFYGLSLCAASGTAGFDDLLVVLIENIRAPF